MLRTRSLKWYLIKGIVDLPSAFRIDWTRGATTWSASNSWPCRTLDCRSWVSQFRIASKNQWTLQVASLLKRRTWIQLWQRSTKCPKWPLIRVRKKSTKRDWLEPHNLKPLRLWKHQFIVRPSPTQYFSALKIRPWCSIKGKPMGIIIIDELIQWASRNYKVNLLRPRQMNTEALNVSFKSKTCSSRLKRTLSWEAKRIDIPTAFRAGSGLSKMRHSNLKQILRQLPNWTIVVMEVVEIYRLVLRPQPIWTWILASMR